MTAWHVRLLHATTQTLQSTVKGQQGITVINRGVGALYVNGDVTNA